MMGCGQDRTKVVVGPRQKSQMDEFCAEWNIQEWLSKFTPNDRCSTDMQKLYNEPHQKSTR